MEDLTKIYKQNKKELKILIQKGKEQAWKEFVAIIKWDP